VKLIDVVIVNYNSDALVNDLLNTLKFFDSEFEYNIVVVDNGSLDGSESKLKTDGKATLISLKSNIGFSAACNLGASHGDAEFILFLNPDCKLHMAIGHDLLATVSKSKYDDCGIFGVQLLSDDMEINKSCYRFPSIVSVLSTSVGLDKVFPGLKLSSSMNDFNHNYEKIVDVVMGAFFLVRRDLFSNLNGFDERFFVYFEEVDFCYRAKLLGVKTVFIPDLSLVHLGCGSTEDIKGLRLFYSLRSRVQFFKKNSPATVFIFVLIITSCIEPVTRVVKDGLKLNSLRDTLYGYSLYFGWLFSGRKRK